MVPGDNEVLDPFLRHEGFKGAVGYLFRRLFGQEPEEADEREDHEKI
jgi:hypothetical protein